MEEKIKFNSWKNKKLVRFMLCMWGLLFFLILGVIVVAVVDSANDIPAEVTLICPKAGLGDTIDDFEKEWNLGYKKVYSEGGTKIGKSDEVCFNINTSWAGNTFGNPPRCGRISGEAKGQWGLPDNEYPNKEYFYKNIKSIMPKDFMLIKSAKMKNFDLNIDRYFFILKSDSIASLDSISNSAAYNGYEPPKPGYFYLMVLEDILDKDRIDNFELSLGNPPSYLYDSTKPINYDPWK
jgi:hypothetical protein